MPKVSSIVLAAALVRSAAAAGCYSAYVAGGSYAARAVVSAPTSVDTTAQVDCVSGTSGCPSSGTKTVTTTTSVTHNYACVTNGNSAFCGQSGYAPGSSYSDLAWTKESTPCTGTAVVTASDTTPEPWTGGPGCPKAFASGSDYDADDLVSADTGSGFKMVYQCTSAPNNLFCGQTGYTPGEGQHWAVAWTALGACSGDMAPTSSPVYTALADAGGCPGAYSSSTRYEQGDRVSNMGLVYQCKDLPLAAHCSQQGYEPGTSVGTGSQVTEYWKSAWTVIGHCKGSIAPTTAPQFNPATSLGGCPNKWVAREAYEEGDRVSVTVSTLPLRQVVYQCKAWPFSSFCPAFEPTAFGGDQGWTLAGSCDGSIGPTASPVFSAIAIGGGCPADWKASTTTYEANDQVSLVVSTVPVRKVVYECRVWPNSGYCNQGEGFKPGTVYGDLAWTMKGSCDGSMAPTSAPIAYQGDCFYDKIVVTKNTGTTTCAHGSSTDCLCSPCTGTSCSQRYTCVKPTDTIRTVQTTVTPWMSSYDYKEGDVIRAGNKRFKCKAWPYNLWCKKSNYQPTQQEVGMWSDAWTKDGVCVDERVVRFVQTTNVTTTSNLTSSITFPGLGFPTEATAQALFVTALEKVLKEKIAASLTGSVSVNKITVTQINGNPVVTINRRLQQIEVLWEAVMEMITSITIATDADGVVFGAAVNGQPVSGAAGGSAAAILAQESAAPLAIGATLLTSLTEAVTAATTAPATEGGGNPFAKALQAQVAAEADSSDSTIYTVLLLLAADIASVVPAATTDQLQAVTTAQATVASQVVEQNVSAVVAGVNLGSVNLGSTQDSPSDLPLPSVSEPTSSPSELPSVLPSVGPTPSPITQGASTTS